MGGLEEGSASCVQALDFLQGREVADGREGGGGDTLPYCSTLNCAMGIYCCQLQLLELEVSAHDVTPENGIQQ
jgi:hypothetical protein